MQPLFVFSSILIRLLLGILLGGLIAYLAWRAHALSRSGAWAATLVGGLIFGLGGLGWAVLLLVFFISSSALSRLFSLRKSAVSEKFSKGSRRDWGQVLANGGLGAILVILHAIFPGQFWPWAAFVGAMAAVNADTWATELGVLSRNRPRLFTTGKPVESGTSGAISLVGSLAAFSGAALVGLVSMIFSIRPLSIGAPASTSSPLGVAFVLLLSAILGGVAGSMIDSYLGATVQAIYYCPACNKETERHPLHSCGTITSRLRGWSWLNNDLVNFSCSLAGALIASFVWFILSR